MRLPLMGMSMTIDEANAHDAYTLNGFHAIFLEPYNSNNHPLNAFFSWMCVSLLGNTEWAMRLPALLFGLATVALAGRFARELTGSRVAGWSAALLLAVTPYHAAYSASSRGYSLAMFFALASGWFLYHALRRPSPRAAAGLALSLGLTALSHLFFMILFAAWGFALGLWGAVLLFLPGARHGRRVAAWVLACLGVGAGAALAVLFYAPSLPLYHEVPFRIIHGMWPEQADPDYEPRWLNADMGEDGSVLAEWDPLDLITRTVTGLTGTAFWLGAAFAAAGGLALAVRRRWGAALPVLAVAVSALMVFLMELKSQNRVYLVMLPFFIVSLGCALASLRPPARLGRMGALAGVFFPAACLCGFSWSMAGGLFAPPAHWEEPKPFYFRLAELATLNHDIKSAAAFLAKERKPGDVVLFDQWRADFRVIAGQYAERFWGCAPEKAALDGGGVSFWFLLPDGPDSEKTPRPEVLAPERMACFDGKVSLWRGTLPCSALRRLKLPVVNSPKWFPLTLDIPLPVSGKTWHLLQIYGRKQVDWGVFGNGDIRVKEPAGTAAWIWQSPAIPAPESRRFLLRAELKDAGPRARLYFMARYFDAAGAELDMVFMRQASAERDESSGFQPAHADFVTPLGVASVAVGVFSVPSHRRPAATEVENFEMWADWDAVGAVQ